MPSAFVVAGQTPLLPVWPKLARCYPEPKVALGSFETGLNIRFSDHEVRQIDQQPGEEANLVEWYICDKALPLTSWVQVMAQRMIIILTAKRSS